MRRLWLWDVRFCRRGAEGAEVLMERPMEAGVLHHRGRNAAEIPDLMAYGMHGGQMLSSVLESDDWPKERKDEKKSEGEFF